MSLRNPQTMNAKVFLLCLPSSCRRSSENNFPSSTNAVNYDAGKSDTNSPGKWSLRAPESKLCWKSCSWCRGTSPSAAGSVSRDRNNRWNRTEGNMCLRGVEGKKKHSVRKFMALSRWHSRSMLCSDSPGCMQNSISSWHFAKKKRIFNQKTFSMLSFEAPHRWWVLTFCRDDVMNFLFELGQAAWLHYHSMGRGNCLNLN